MMIFIDLRAVLGTSRHRILLLHRRRHRCRVVCAFTHRRHLIELSRFERPFLRGVVFLSGDAGCARVVESARRALRLGGAARLARRAVCGRGGGVSVCLFLRFFRGAGEGEDGMIFCCKFSFASLHDAPTACRWAFDAIGAAPL